MSLYYNQKVIRLVEKLFLDTGDARTKIINCERQIEDALWGSKQAGINTDLWEKYWKELNVKDDWYNSNGSLIASSLFLTVRAKRNKSLQKYLHFFLKEYMEATKAAVTKKP